MPEIISSSTNNRIKELQKLYRKKYRKELGRFVLEGYRLIEESIKGGAEVVHIFMTPDFFNGTEGKVICELLIELTKISLVEEKILAEVTDTVNPQGVVAVVEEPGYKINEVLEDSKLLLVLDRIQDPGNMGTIIRTAVAAGVDGIIVLKGSVDIFNLKVLRSTMGAIFKIPIVTGIDLEMLFELCNDLKGEFALISADLSGKPYNHLNYPERVMLVIGNEANGISTDILNISTLKVTIPIIGEIDSLNAGVAAGILMYKIFENWS